MKRAHLPNMLLYIKILFWYIEPPFKGDIEKFPLKPTSCVRQAVSENMAARGWLSRTWRAQYIASDQDVRLAGKGRGEYPEIRKATRRSCFSSVYIPPQSHALSLSTECYALLLSLKFLPSRLLPSLWKNCAPTPVDSAQGADRCRTKPMNEKPRLCVKTVAPTRRRDVVGSNEMDLTKKSSKAAVIPSNSLCHEGQATSNSTGQMLASVVSAFAPSRL